MAKIIRKDLEAKLAALNGAEWDSMSDDSMGDEVTQDDVDMVIADDDEDSDHEEKETGKPRKKKVARSVVPIGPAGQPSGVVYIGHIPHGFYEEAMNGFFSQFGDVVRVRVSRSKKSTRCKGYAYVEFASPEVACIVAETIDGYYLYEKQLVCRVLKFDEIHPSLFNGAGIRFKKVNWHGMYRERYNANRTPSKDKNHVKKLLARDNAKRKRLAGLGIDYDFDGFATSLKDRQAAEGPVQAVVESNSKEKGSGSKKRKSEEKAAPTNPSGERKEPPSITKTKVDEKPMTKTSKKSKVSASKKTKANTPSKSKHGEDEKSPPSSTKTKSVKSQHSGAADKRKMSKQEAANTPASGSQKGRKEAGSGGSDQKNKTKTPTKEKGVASRNPLSSEGKPVKDKGSASKGSSTKRKASKSPAHKDDGAPSKASKGNTKIPGSEGKGTKMMVPKGSSSPAGDRRAKRNKPSQQ